MVAGKDWGVTGMMKKVQLCNNMKVLNVNDLYV